MCDLIDTPFNAGNKKLNFESVQEIFILIIIALRSLIWEFMVVILYFPLLSLTVESLWD